MRQPDGIRLTAPHKKELLGPADDSKNRWREMGD
jgi:hypothetical protein